MTDTVIPSLSNIVMEKLEWFSSYQIYYTYIYTHMYMCVYIDSSFQVGVHLGNDLVINFEFRFYWVNYVSKWVGLTISVPERLGYRQVFTELLKVVDAFL